MTSNNEEKAQDAADRIKAAALSAAKGLSRAQAERAATAAARNVNAYGQKEEGPSRWQERKEAKRQMYLRSTEKAVKLGVRKDLKNTVSSTNGVSSQCQKCYEVGHWTYECKNERVYISRPSRTQILKNPKMKTTVSASSELENPDIGIEEKGVSNRKKEKGEKSQKKSKRKHRSDTDSDTSEASVFESDSDSSVTGSGSSEESSSSSSSSDSEYRRRKRRKQKKRRHRRLRRNLLLARDESRKRMWLLSPQTESSETESVSDSDSDDKGSRRKSRRHGRKH